MWFCEGGKIDWTAVAAILALIVWLFDKYQRRNERAANARLLAQIMTAPVGAAHIEIAKLRNWLFPPNGNLDNANTLFTSQEHRKILLTKVQRVKFDFPSQFLDKADIFSELVTNKLAYSYSQVNHLNAIAQLLADLPDTPDDEISSCTEALFKQITETENSIAAANKALLRAGKSKVGI